MAQSPSPLGSLPLSQEWRCSQTSDTLACFWQGLPSPLPTNTHLSGIIFLCITQLPRDSQDCLLVSHLPDSHFWKIRIAPYLAPSLILFQNSKFFLCASEIQWIDRKLFFWAFLLPSSPNWLFPNHTAPALAPCEGSWILFHISDRWAYNKTGVLFASYWCFQATLFHRNRQHWNS